MDADSVKQLLGASGEASGVPLEHMDYDYISNSSNVKELEKILRALRSGKEGIFPDLIKHCEERIGELNPKSKLLRKDKRPATEYDLGKDEWQRVHSDLKDFVNQAQATDQTLHQDGDSEEDANVPVRSTVTIEGSGQCEETNHVPDHKPSKDRIKSSDYDSWEKFDVNKEIERADEAPETKDTRNKAQQLNASRSSGVQEKLNTEGCSAKEVEMRANREKDKGNEAFRAGDYSEAIVYYTRSLSVVPSAPAYNNRALARIRLEQFPSAIADCNKVLELEPDNLKAMLRRGTARKSLHQYEEAARDLEYVLSVEPGNKQAKDLLKDVKKKMTPRAPPSTVPNGHGKGKRMVIEEVEGSDSSGDGDVTDGNIPGRRKSPEGREERKEANEVAANGSADTVENMTADGKENEKQTGGVFKGNAKTGEGGVQAKPSIPGVTQASSSQVPAKKVATEAVQTGPGAVSQGSWSGQEQDEQVVLKPESPVVVAPPKPLPEKVVKLKDEGTQLYKAGQYAHAKEKYATALSVLEKDEASYQSAIASLYSNRSACQLKLGDCQGCIADCDTSLKMSPYNVKVYLRRGSAYETLERYNHAYLDYQQALTLDHYNTTAQTAATRVVKVLQDQNGPTWRDKLPARTLISRSPKPPAAPLQVNGPVGDGEAPDGTATVKAAAPTREKPPVVPTRKALTKEELFTERKTEGNSLVKKGQYEDAIQCYTACTEIDPGQAVPFTNRALCYLKLNQHDKAEEDCTKAIELDPKNVKGFYRRALARKGRGNFFDSIRDLSTLLKLEPTNTSAKKELEIVKDSWRKELREKPQKPSDTTAESDKAPNTKKNVLIEEAESDSEEEKNVKRNVTPERKPSGKKGADTNRENAKNNRNEAKPSEKHKNHRTKSKKDEKDAKNSKAAQAAQAPKLNKVTAYEFMQAWMSLKATKDSLPYAELLRQVPPDQLPTVLSNKLDAQMLTMILKAVEDHLIRSDAEWSYRLLSHLCKAQRFQTVLLFMTNEEKQGIDKCLASLAAEENKFCSSEDIERLRKSFGLIS